MDDDHSPRTLNEMLRIAPFQQLERCWRIGSGCQDLNNSGVDLLLCIEDDEEKGYRGSDEDRVAGIHARFSWLKGAGGFFLVADNKRRKKVMMNVECVFFLRYENLSAEEDEQFHVELTKHFREHYKTQSPLALPIPKKIDMHFGDWIVQHPISKRAFGIVYMVINIRTGQPAAARQISKSKRNAAAVEQELEMTWRISGTLQWYHQLGQTKAQTPTLKPTLHVILHEYILISPLVNTTFRSLYASNVSAEDRVACFAQLLEAIDFLHRHGIWHRDVKPDSVLVKSYDPPDVILTGFGCASDATDISYDSAGTEQYRAPEQVEGRTHDRAVDYWGCSIIGLELILKRPIESRIVPGLGFTYYQKVLEDLQDSPLARCSRKMLEEGPGSRMTAIDALLDLRGPKTGGARVDLEFRCDPPKCHSTNDVDFIEVHSDNEAADLVADFVASDESFIADSATGDCPAQVDSTNGFARSSSMDPSGDAVGQRRSCSCKRKRCRQDRRSVYHGIEQEEKTDAMRDSSKNLGIEF
ncbi:hypothetical protein PENNAL_c0023G05563 [Penicillium nalgiovense]|uniref:Protein kinase domain-containing protein n=1 Tax=Penicillium nalgiovense TaxID=60175 RepID=A0A1V6YEN3_PENNA|nr:hypothetical protein PENNAL_c0023G05563 [Penicillium nalgiovense]